MQRLACASCKCCTWRAVNYSAFLTSNMSKCLTAVYWSSVYWRARVLVDLVVCWYKKHYTANGWPFHLIAKFQAQRLASLGKDLGENSLHTLHCEILKLSTLISPPSEGPLNGKLWWIWGEADPGESVQFGLSSVVCAENQKWTNPRHFPVQVMGNLSLHLQISAFPGTKPAPQKCRNEIFQIPSFKC